MNSAHHLNSNSRETSVDMLAGFHGVSINRGFTIDPTTSADLTAGSKNNIILSDAIDDLPEIQYQNQKRPIQNVSQLPKNMRRLKIDFENTKTNRKDNLNTQSLD